MDLKHSLKKLESLIGVPIDEKAYKESIEILLE